MKTVIFCSSPKFLWIFKKSAIYIRRSFSVNKNKNVIFVMGDIFSAEDYRFCNHKASLIEDELINKIIDIKKISFLLNWGGETYAQYFIGESIIQNASNVFESFDYAEKVKSKYNIKQNVYIFPLNFSFRVYKEMEEMGVIPQNIKIHFLSKVYIRFYNLLKFLFFFIRLVSYPEITTLNAKNQRNFTKYNYKSCAYLDDGVLGKVSKNNKIFSLFDNEETLYIDNGYGYRNVQLWPNQVRKIGAHVLELEDVVKEISAIKYLRQFYKSAFIWRYRMVRLTIKHPFLSRACSRATRERILWDIFYSKFNTKNAVSIMMKEDLTSSIVHKKHKTKTIFLYFSTQDKFGKRIDKNKSNCHDFTHMIVDNIISSRISNNWIKTLENNVGHYTILGPIFSDLVTIASHNKKEVYDKINIKQNAKIISFFDCSVGFRGVMTFESYRRFIDGMLMLAKKNTDIYFLFKSKKNLSTLKMNMGGDILRIINSIKEMPNCIYANEFDLITYDLIGASDLVVSMPMSSVIYEALCGGIKTVSFDPSSQYVDYDDITNKFPKFNAVNYDELEKLVNYWIYQSEDKDLDVFINNYIRPNVDQKVCEMSMIDRFKEILYV